jgi:hypothetical protein
VIPWSPAKLLMIIWAFNPFETQWSYRTRKSAGVHTVADAVVYAVAAGGDELEPVPFWTTSAQEGELDMVAVLCCCGCCCRCDANPASQADPPSLPVSGWAEPQRARLGVADGSGVSSGTASKFSARGGRGGGGCGVQWLVTLTV